MYMYMYYRSSKCQSFEVVQIENKVLFIEDQGQLLQEWLFSACPSCNRYFLYPQANVTAMHMSMHLVYIGNRVCTYEQNVESSFLAIQGVE